MAASDLARTEAVAVDVRGVSKSFNAVTVLDGIDLTVEAGEVVALLGPSGCGKTTLLRILAGLMRPERGAVRFNGRPVIDVAGAVDLPPERRELGMVFQDYALWPHLSVGGNVAFPLEMRRLARPVRQAAVEKALARVGLAGYAARMPGTLSGGQQQRVALARAIVAEPGLILFDEPLSNLDKELRESLANEIAALVRDIGTTAVYVTHDQSEAFALADRVAVMKAGRVLQFDAPEVVFRQPADEAVATFLDAGSLLSGRVATGAFETADGAVRLALPSSGRIREGSASLLVPRAAVSLAERGGRADATLTVRRSLFRGDNYLVTAGPGHPGGAEIAFTTAAELNVGGTVDLVFDRARLMLYAGGEAYRFETTTGEVTICSVA